MQSPGQCIQLHARRVGRGDSVSPSLLPWLCLLVSSSCVRRCLDWVFTCLCCVLHCASAWPHASHHHHRRRFINWKFIKDKQMGGRSRACMMSDVDVGAIAMISFFNYCRLLLHCSCVPGLLLFCCWHSPAQVRRAAALLDLVWAFLR